MKIIHIEGGLGNQMAAYAVYVAAVESNPGEKIYIDTYVYDVKEAHSTISMWNGYELDRVFGVAIPDIRTLFTDKEVQEQLEYLRESEFWKHDWNYAETFICMMKKYGINLKSAYDNVSRTEIQGFKAAVMTKIRKYIASASKNRIAYVSKQFAFRALNTVSGDCGKYLFQKREGDYYYDLTLDFMKSRFLHEKIGQRVRNDLTFDELVDENNLSYLRIIRTSNSISVHVRRSDYLKFNEDCYKYGYFKKAIKYVKKKVEHPVFFLFSDDLEWCRNNYESIGLNARDTIYYVDINSARESYRDMQLMANCKHNIATKSSFGWWGSFLNPNPDKITCCQISSYISTNQF